LIEGIASIIRDIILSFLLLEGGAKHLSRRLCAETRDQFSLVIVQAVACTLPKD
jgi:hypothetical protein